LGRNNNIYTTPRTILKFIFGKINETKRNKTKALCCGAGGGQIFKESEPGVKEINIERTEELLNTKSNYIATCCPFCMIMINDGVNHFNNKQQVEILDIAELLNQCIVEKSDPILKQHQNIQ
jgi:Fe-S oxidoreductase